MFETETNAGAVISATMADFYSKEFDGTQRKIVFNSMGLYPTKEERWIIRFF